MVVEAHDHLAASRRFLWRRTEVRHRSQRMYPQRGGPRIWSGGREIGEPREHLHWGAMDSHTLPASALLDLPVSGVSFDDRLWVFGVLETGSISTLAYSVDGGTWTERASSPPGLRTAQPIATAVFRDRLYVFASDATTGRLRMTSTADVATWSAWVDIPPNPGAGRRCRRRPPLRSGTS